MLGMVSFLFGFVVLLVVALSNSLLSRIAPRKTREIFLYSVPVEHLGVWFFVFAFHCALTRQHPTISFTFLTLLATYFLTVVRMKKMGRQIKVSQSVTETA